MFDFRNSTFNPFLFLPGSGIFGIFLILSETSYFPSFLASGLVTEITMVIIIAFIILLACAMAFVPQWVSSRLKISLEKSLVFGFALTALVFALVITVGLGPEPPGGWELWGLPKVEL